MVIKCIVNIDDINYKINVSCNHDENRDTAYFDDILKAVVKHDDLNVYDFTNNLLIFEIFDKSINEYVVIDDDTEIKDLSKIRVKTLDPNCVPPVPSVNPDDIPFSEFIEGKSDGEILELVVEKHVPSGALIEKLDNPSVTLTNFTINNVRIKRQLVKSIVKYQKLFANNTENAWNMIVADIRAALGNTFRNLCWNRTDLGFTRIGTHNCERELIALIGQYNGILRKCGLLTFQEACQLWPFFRYFHKDLNLELIYPERGPSLKIMRKEFDNHQKG